MKTNKPILILLGISIIFNLKPLLFNTDEQESNSNLNEENINLALNDPNNEVIFGQIPETDIIEPEKSEAEQMKFFKEKISILATQNTLFQKQLDDASLKQQNILNAINTIVDKIDSQLLTPQAPVSDFEPSSYNLNFDTISRDVVKQCMKVTTESASNVRQQQRFTREQLLQEEQTDHVWSSEVEAQIQSVFSNSELSNSELLSLNCRSTICQIKIQHYTPEAKKLFEVPFFSSFQQTVSQYDETYDKNTNQSTGIFYLSRNKEN
jgi:hypothetical protein